MNTDL